MGGAPAAGRLVVAGPPQHSRVADPVGDRPAVGHRDGRHGTPGAVFVLGASELFLALAGYGLPPRRKLAGHALAAALALFLTLLLASLRGQSLTADVLAFLLAVIVVALVGSFIPAVLEAVAGSLLLHSFAIAQPGAFTAGRISNAAVPGCLRRGGRGSQLRSRRRRAAHPAGSPAAGAARSIAEADRSRTALLAAVSHDLRSHDVRLTAEDHDELLAAVDESLDLLTRLAASLLDVSRLQAGSLSVFPRPTDLGEIIASSLDDFGPLARTVTVNVPCDLPQVMADQAIMERVIVNLVGNALRYAPAGSPLRPLPLTSGTYVCWCPVAW